MRISLLIKLLLVACVAFFAQKYTQGFRFYQILSDLPPNENLHNSPLPVDLLTQPFTYLGSGDQCYAFIGKDGKTVLKFFKHYHRLQRRELTPILQSCQLAYDELKEETGLIAIHLNKTQGACPVVTLIDRLGIAYPVALDETEFALQHKAEMLFPSIDAYIQKGDLKRVREAMHSLFAFVRTRCERGIADTDTAIRRNFGLLDQSVVDIDIGSFRRDETLKDPARTTQELHLKTKRLERWLRKHYPDLLPDYTQCFDKILPDA
jgi:hypothetical protein